MRTSTLALAVVVVVALAGWARAGDTKDLSDRLKVMEDRLAAVEHGTPLPGDGIVRVRGLVVQDSKGKDRVVIDATDHGTGGVTIRDAEGKPRLLLGMEAFGPHVLFLGSEGKEVFGVTSAARGTSMALAAGPDRKQSLMLDAPVDGAVGLGIWGGPGVQGEQSQAGFWIWQDGTIAWGGGPRSPGMAGFHLKYDRDGKVNFEVRDAAESVLWQMPKTKDPLH